MSAKITDQIRAAFNFDVVKLPLVGPDNAKTPFYGMFRSDTGASVGAACSRKYRPHTVDDICALVEAASDAFGGDVQVKCGWREGHVVTVQPSDDYRRSIFGTKDNVFARAIIRAGYDASPFVGSLGLYADKCKNLHIISAAGGAVHARIRHSANMWGRIGELRDQFYELAQNFDRSVETVRTMESREMVVADYLRQVFPRPEAAEQPGRAETLYYKRMEAIVTRIARERSVVGRLNRALDKATAWEIYSGVQGYIQHESTRHGKPDAFERAISALDSGVVARALEVAIAG